MSVISQNQAGNSNQIPHLYQSIILGLIISKLKLTKVNVSLLLGHEVTDTITEFPKGASARDAIALHLICQHEHFDTYTLLNSTNKFSYGFTSRL